MSQMSPSELQAHVAALQEASVNVSATKAKLAAKKKTKTTKKSNASALADEFL